MKAFTWQFVCAFILLFIVFHIAEAPLGLIVHEHESSDESRIVLAFAGDVMLGRNVEVLMEKHGRQYPFASTSELFDKADFVILNLEGPIPEKHVRTLSGQMSFSFPFYVPQVLNDHGVDAVSLANNHTFDKGSAVYTDTAHALQVANISPFGHPTKQDVHYARNYILNGVPFTLIGFNATFPSFDIDEAIQAVKDAERMFPEGVIVVFMHWGDEYEPLSSTYQRSIARALHDAGVNIVIGAHPHVTQEVECQGIHRCTVFSLGNFIFDQYFSKDVEEGLVVYVTLTRQGIEQMELVPIDGNHSQPQFMDDSESFVHALTQRSRFADVIVSTSTGAILLRGN